MRKKITFLFGVALAIAGVFFIPQQTKADCANIGAGNDAHCFGDIEFACLHSNLDHDCNYAISNEDETSAEFE